MQDWLATYHLLHPSICSGIRDPGLATTNEGSGYWALTMGPLGLNEGMEFFGAYENDVEVYPYQLVY
jgi:hypothetical protein